MTKEEAVKLLTIISTCYPNAKMNDFSDLELNISVQVWSNSFNDTPFEVVLNALNQHILKNVFPPTIAEIRKLTTNITAPSKIPSAEESWEKVINAVKRFGFYQQDKAFETFDDRTKRAVRLLGWATICKSEAIGIERANFLKFYDSFSADEKDAMLFPQSLTDKIMSLMTEAQEAKLIDGK